MSPQLIFKWNSEWIIIVYRIYGSTFIRDKDQFPDRRNLDDFNVRSQWLFTTLTCAKENWFPIMCWPKTLQLKPRHSAKLPNKFVEYFMPKFEASNGKLWCVFTVKVLWAGEKSPKRARCAARWLLFLYRWKPELKRVVSRSANCPALRFSSLIRICFVLLVTHHTLDAYDDTREWMSHLLAIDESISEVIQF